MASVERHWRQQLLMAGCLAPPPRDSLAVTVTARMTDGREASASAPLVIVS